MVSNNPVKIDSHEVMKFHETEVDEISWYFMKFSMKFY
jgi:hypothetical protein